jgi:seryl-tRNA synthetase
MNGRAVYKLVNLRKVVLDDNICVSGTFEGGKELNELVGALEINCRYDEEPMRKIQKIETEMKNLKIANEVSKKNDERLSKAFELFEKLKKKDDEIESMKVQVKSLKEKIEAMERMEQDF